MSQGGNLVRDASEGPDVGLEGVGLVGAHLGGEVVGGAGDGGGEVVRALEDAGDAEIAEFDDAAATEEDVLRLEVAVHDAESVDVVERERDLRRPVEHLALGKVSPRLARAADVGEQVALLGVRGDDAQRLGLLLEKRLLVRDDVRVAQLRQELRLRERLAALRHLVHGDLLRHVRTALLAVHHQVARPVVSTPDHLAELVLLHRARSRSRGRAPRRTNAREPRDSAIRRGAAGARCDVASAVSETTRGSEGGSGSRVPREGIRLFASRARAPRAETTVA